MNEWTRCTSRKTGKMYYFNCKTRQALWDKEFSNQRHRILFEEKELQEGTSNCLIEPETKSNVPYSRNPQPSTHAPEAWSHHQRSKNAGHCSSYLLKPPNMTSPRLSSSKMQEQRAMSPRTLKRPSEENEVSLKRRKIETMASCDKGSRMNDGAINSYRKQKDPNLTMKATCKKSLKSLNDLRHSEIRSEEFLPPQHQVSTASHVQRAKGKLKPPCSSEQQRVPSSTIKPLLRSSGSGTIPFPTRPGHCQSSNKPCRPQDNVKPSSRNTDKRSSSSNNNRNSHSDNKPNAKTMSELHSGKEAKERICRCNETYASNQVQRLKCAVKPSISPDSIASSSASKYRYCQTISKPLKLDRFQSINKPHKPDPYQSINKPSQYANKPKPSKSKNMPLLSQCVKSRSQPSTSTLPVAKTAIKRNISLSTDKPHPSKRNSQQFSSKFSSNQRAAQSSTVPVPHVSPDTCKSNSSPSSTRIHPSRALISLSVSPNRKLLHQFDNNPYPHVSSAHESPSVGDHNSPASHIRQSPSTERPLQCRSICTTHSSSITDEQCQSRPLNEPWQSSLNDKPCPIQSTGELQHSSRIPQSSIHDLHPSLQANTVQQSPSTSQSQENKHSLDDIITDMEVDTPVIKEGKFLVIVDTNVLISGLSFLKDLRGKNIEGLGDVVLYIPYIVMQELDGLKGQKRDVTRSVSVAAWKASDFLHKNRSDPHVKGQSYGNYVKNTEQRLDDTSDDRILQFCLQCKKICTIADKEKVVVLLTNDKNLSIKASFSGVPSCGQQNFAEEIKKQVERCAEQGVFLDVVELSPSKDKSDGRPYHQTLKEEKSAANDTGFDEELMKEEEVNLKSQAVVQEHNELLDIQPVAPGRSQDTVPHHSSPSPSTQAHEDAEIGASGNLENEIIQKMILTLESALSVILQREMMECYTHHWLAIVHRKPPWTLMTALQSIKKHYMAVFQFILERWKEVEVDELIGIVMKLRQNGSLSPSQVESFHLSSMAILMPLIKNTKYKEVSVKCKQDLKNLYNSWKSKLKHNSQETTESCLPQDQGTFRKDTLQESEIMLISPFDTLPSDASGSVQHGDHGTKDRETRHDNGSFDRRKSCEESNTARDSEYMIVSPIPSTSVLSQWTGPDHKGGAKYQGDRSTSDSYNVQDVVRSDNLSDSGRKGMDGVTFIILSIFEGIWKILQNHRDAIMASMLLPSSTDPVTDLPTKDQSLAHLQKAIPPLQGITDSLHRLLCGADSAQLSLCVCLVEALRTFISALQIEMNIELLQPTMLQEFISKSENRERLIVGGHQLKEMLHQLVDCVAMLSR